MKEMLPENLLSIGNQRVIGLRFESPISSRSSMGCLKVLSEFRHMFLHPLSGIKKHTQIHILLLRKNVTNWKLRKDIEFN